jgi:hypothetical protein
MHGLFALLQLNDQRFDPLLRKAIEPLVQKLAIAGFYRA